MEKKAAKSRFEKMRRERELFQKTVIPLVWITINDSTMHRIIHQNDTKIGKKYAHHMSQRSKTIRDEEQFLLLVDVHAFVVKLAPSRYTLCWSALTLTEWHLRSL